MGFASAIAMVALIFVVVLLVSRWDAKTAYRMLNHSQHLFEPESKDVSIMPLGGHPTKRKRFSPLVSKQVAARQWFRCALCNRLFDDSLWDLDHIVPLFRGGTNDLSNIRALCRACHMNVSATQRAL